jgi:hypothetical protein
VAGEVRHIDISGAPALQRLARVVRSTNTTHVLRDSGRDLVEVRPLSAQPSPPRVAAPRKRREKLDADYEAFASAFGGWKGLVDAKKVKRAMAESRRILPRAPLEL